MSFDLLITWFLIVYIVSFKGLTENRYGELGSLFKYFLIKNSYKSDGWRIPILLCIETKKENIQRIGINSLFFKFLCQAFIAPKQKILNPSSLELTKRQRNKTVSTKGL